MPRKPKTISVTTHTHAPQLFAAAARYAKAAQRWRAAEAETSGGLGRHLARARFTEVSADLDKMLGVMVQRYGSKTRELSTGTDAALVKAAARNLADTLDESTTALGCSPQAAADQLRTVVYSVLAAREAEDAQTFNVEAPVPAAPVAA